MQALDIAHKLATFFEGFRSRPYRCPAGVWTIGYGSTYYPDGTRVKPTDQPVTESQASMYLDHELLKTMLSVARICPILLTSDNRLAAITDFAYNLGIGRLQASTLRRKINAGDWNGAKNELAKWVRASGRILPGLVKRRSMEASYL